MGKSSRGEHPLADLSHVGKVEWRWYKNLQMLLTVLRMGKERRSLLPV